MNHEETPLPGWAERITAIGEKSRQGAGGMSRRRMSVESYKGVWAMQPDVVLVLAMAPDQEGRSFTSAKMSYLAVGETRATTTWHFK
jgi:hypothetical protein